MFPGGRIGDRTVGGQQHQSGGFGVDGPGHHRRQRHCRDQFTGGQCGRSLVGREQNRRHRNGFGHRAGHAPSAQPFAGDHQIHRMGGQAVELLGHRKRGHTEIGQLIPDLAPRCGVTVGPGPNRGRNIGGAECGVDTGGEIALFGVESEPHDGLAPSLGRPSSRSAMILR